MIPPHSSIAIPGTPRPETTRATEALPRQPRRAQHNAARDPSACRRAADSIRGKIVHTRNRHLRNNRGFSEAFSNGCSVTFSNNLSLANGISRRIVTFPVHFHWKCPMDFQWRVPIDFPFVISRVQSFALGAALPGRNSHPCAGAPPAGGWGGGRGDSRCRSCRPCTHRPSFSLLRAMWSCCLCFFVCYCCVLSTVYSPTCGAADSLPDDGRNDEDDDNDDDHE